MNTNFKIFIKGQAKALALFNLIPAGGIGLLSALFWVMGDINYFWMGIIFAGLAITFTMILSIPFLVLTYLWKVIRTELANRAQLRRYR